MEYEILRMCYDRLMLLVRYHGFFVNLYAWKVINSLKKGGGDRGKRFIFVSYLNDRKMADFILAI